MPSELDIHLVLDNYGTHKTQLIRDWLVKRPRFHLHFTPTSASWLNRVERWFAPVPDETTILNFRHLLEAHELCGQVLDAVNLYLASKGIRITTGTIVDATIIHAPSSTKNEKRERDPEMHQTRKGNQ